MFDWDDLKVFLAAARAGSLSGAAARLGVDSATVGRRIARLESAMRATLLARSPQGLQLTAAGTRLMGHAAAAETAMNAAAESIGDAASGVVRISVSEGFGADILAPALPALRRSRPGLRIELAANPGFLSPATREVDLAITLSAPQDARLTVEPLTDYQLALYAAPSFVARSGQPRNVADLSGLDVVGYVDDLIYAPELRYLEEIGITQRPALASSSIRAQRTIIAGGGGFGVLPCFMADGLVRLCPREVLLTRRFWLSAHRDIAETARVKAVRSWVRTLAREKRAALSPW